MASTLLEQTRQYHEDMERLERLIVKEFQNEPRTHKEKLRQSHRVRAMLDLIQERASQLVEIYEDSDNARKDDIASLRGDDVFKNFYERYNETVEYHKRFSTEDLTGPDADADAALMPVEVDVPFSGEEAYGRFLDLNELHQMWQNSSCGSQTDYLSYVRELPTHLDSIPLAARKEKDYEIYLKELYQYLESFYHRSQPLSQWEKKLEIVEQEFNALWDAGEVPIWQVECEEGKTDDHSKTNTATKTEQKGDSLHHRNIALLEWKLKALCKALESVISDTVARIEKRQAQTWAEIEAEKEEEAEEDIPLEEEDLDDEEDDYIYNPLKLPLGWDGKPIPYWLYKLHGLNKEYKCEICGGASYWGRRSFEKHFKEAKHQAGMRALGIPNTKQFFEVTSIADAMALWKTMQEKQKSDFKAEEDEEYEDEEGNVYSKKVYLDLKRQGIL